MNNEQVEVQSVEVLDVYGKLVTVVGANNYSPLQPRINVGNLPAGVYMLKITTTDGTSCVKKIVKK